jgi:thiol-disulfide isomerase/thioredoxin
MKKALFVTLTILCFMTTDAQTPYTAVNNNGNELILNGIITKYAIQNSEKLNTWYANSSKGYNPSPSLVAAMQAASGKVQFVIFGGTWCEDTQNILPKFFACQEKAAFADNAISFYGVDRAKTTLGNLHKAFGITNVPTVIVMKDGKEVGRVVEYGKTGKWDEEIAALLK